MHLSSSPSRGGNRAGPVKYAHSPYVYRTTAEDAPISPLSDQGRPNYSSVPTYYSPRSLSPSVCNVDNNSLSGFNKSTHNSALSSGEVHSQPSSPLGRPTTAPQEYSQPIQVGSAPNVHARYRRGLQSPMARAGNESGNRSGFPSSPPGSLPPRSPFTSHENKNTSAFAGGESAPVRGLNNPYGMPIGGSLSAPQHTRLLCGSYRISNNNNLNSAGGCGSGTQSPAPYHARQLSGNGAPASPPFAAPPMSATNTSSIAVPAYGSSTGNTNGNTTATKTNNNNGINNNNSYAPTGFSVPPTMAAMGSGSFHGSPSLRVSSQPGSYVDPRSSHSSSPQLTSNGRPPIGSPGHVRGEPISPTHTFSGGPYGATVHGDGGGFSPNANSKGRNSAPPPAIAAAMQQQSQQQQSGGFAVGSFPDRRSVPPGHRSSSFLNNNMLVDASGAGSDPSPLSEPYSPNTKTLNAFADDTMSSSGKSGSSASSIRDDLLLCPNDDACTAINDRKHQKKYAHTCRLFPCYHGHVARHAKLFRHAPGQISLPEGLTAGAKVSSHALASVNFNTISPEAPNAYRIYVSHRDKSYEIFGDWASVKVHTFKRYLHQVYHIPPGSQILSVMKTGKVMDDDINTVKCYGIEEDSVILLRSDIEDAPASGKLRIPLDDL